MQEQQKDNIYIYIYYLDDKKNARAMSAKK